MITTVLMVLAAVGILFNILAVIGLFRFPDVYTRLHAATKCTTFGTIFIAIAAIVYGIVMINAGTEAFGEFSIHAAVALVAILLTNPTGAHAISRAAYKSGTKPALAVVDMMPRNDAGKGKQKKSGKKGVKR